MPNLNAKITVDGFVYPVPRHIAEEIKQILVPFASGRVPEKVTENPPKIPADAPEEAPSEASASETGTAENTPPDSTEPEPSPPSEG